MQKKITRTSVRAILVTPSKEVLLFKVYNKDENWSGWITPGGGIENSETETEALLRELYEETGVNNFRIGQKVWTRYHEFIWNQKLIQQSEVYFWVETEKFDINPNVELEKSEFMIMREHRWFCVDEMKLSNDHFVPQNFLIEYEKLLSNGFPNKPIKVGL